MPLTIQTGEALAMARPTQAVLLTGLRSNWPQVREAMGLFRRALRRRAVTGVYAFHTEPNPQSSSKAHVHLWWRGDTLTEAVVSEVAQVAGMGAYVGVKPAHAQTARYAVPTIEYGLKLVLNRPRNPTETWPGAAAYLSLNGGRLIHSTHGFWQDWNGQRLTLRQARTLAHRWPHTGGQDTEAA